MILSGQTIRRRVKNPLPGDDPFEIQPFHERTVCEGMSYGLSGAGYDLRVKLATPKLVMKPGAFELVTTLERLALPADVMGMLADKSTWARRGIAVQNTIFEPGWRGYPTLEISNHGHDTITILDGMPIAQMVFVQVDKAVERPYTGKYQDQAQSPTKAKEEQP